MNAPLETRPSPIAGQWYSSNPRQLADQVDRYITEAQLPALVGEPIAIMTPHAGHRYSGPVAGYAFASIKGLQPEIVAVISPMHYPYEQSLLTTAHEAYATPLGPIPVDRECVEELDITLRKSLGFGLARIRRDPEHSLEIELPFLQRSIQTPFRLLPVMMRDQSADVARSLGESLVEILQQKSALLVASTDLSHFYPQAIAEVLDSEVLRQVQAFDPMGVLQAEYEGRGFACGHGALAATLWAAKGLGGDHVQILHYATSGNVTGDYDRVVGYGAAVITRSKTAS